MRAKFKIHLRVQNNGDGGYSIYGYNSVRELLDDHPMEGKGPDGALTAEQRHEILSEDDPYENGYIEQADIYIDVDEDGYDVSLADRLYFHAGQ